MNADGSDPESLTSDLASASAPTWSPDGTQIAIQSFTGGNVEIFVMAADGSDPTNVTNHSANDVLPNWGSTSTGYLMGRIPTSSRTS